MRWIVPYPFPVPVLGFDSVAKAADSDSDGSVDWIPPKGRGYVGFELQAFDGV